MMNVSSRPTLVLAAVTWTLLQSLLLADEKRDDTADLLNAVERADFASVKVLLGSADVNITNDKGKTPLMIAAESGNFEICRALLWSGADPTKTDADGKGARDHLKPDCPDFMALNLLLRCFAFVAQHPVAAISPNRPNMAIISDEYIDHNHHALKGHYWMNEAEAKGKPGVDDDKNGFVDDVYGWNAETDEPLRTPMVANMADHTDRVLLEKLVSRYNRREEAYGIADQDVEGDDDLGNLEEKYENPLVRQIGFDNLMSAGLDLNDLAFTKLLINASHGTHVAGIVLKSSNQKAIVHGMNFGRFQTPKEGVVAMLELASELAPRTISYEQFVQKMRQTLLEEALKQGERRSAYLRSVGAGVVNMSWGESKEFFAVVAERIQQIYELNGMDPESMNNYICPIGLDLCSDLALELLAASTADTALTIHQNPNVLFVTAAGNESNNNDEGLPSPAYLSRFFPNVITVASVDDAGNMSGFSNYGAASVQVAAPGEKIRSCLLADQEGIMSGTSMAAPAVTGLVARLRAEFPKLDASDVRIILERSVTPHDSLKGRIATGGAINPEAAIALAKQWSPGSRADLVLAALTAPDRTQNPGEISSEEEAHAPVAISTRKGDTGMRISAIGGFAKDWRIVMSSGDGAKAQVVLPNGSLPIDTIKNKWLDGFEITSIGGENDGWRVVMSEGKGRRQKLVGLDFDQSLLKQFISADDRITSFAGYGSHWVFVLTSKTGWGDQRFCLPGPFDDSRREWITARMKEGYRITGLGGDSNMDDRSKDTWVVVMTKGTRLGDQVITGPAAWPADWIRTHETDSYRITQLSGFADRWVVVMSQDTGVQQQTVSKGGEWSDDWVKKYWQSPK